MLRLCFFMIISFVLPISLSYYVTFSITCRLSTYLICKSRLPQFGVYIWCSQTILGQFILGMAIDFKIANRLIAICSDQLNGNSYQNTLFYVILLFIFLSLSLIPKDNRNRNILFKVWLNNNFFQKKYIHYVFMFKSKHAYVIISS